MLSSLDACMQGSLIAVLLQGWQCEVRSMREQPRYLL